jgi:hypothetical protein
MPNYDEKVGLLREATIVDYDPVSDTIQIQLNTASAVKGNNRISMPAPAPHVLFQENGLYIGTQPQLGSTIIVAQGSGNRYYFVNWKSDNSTNVPEVKLGELLIQSNENTKIKLNTSGNISIGSDVNKLNISVGDKNNQKTNILTVNFENQNQFTQASRQVIGLVKRDLNINVAGFDQDSKLEDDSYDPFYSIIGMDPSSTSNDIIAGPSKNPPFVEYREMIHEFQYSSDVSSDLNEYAQYGTDNKTVSNNFTFPNRRKSRADTLSLTLIEPNYLMETIKGTVVDIFGNILDLNRMPLPVGKDQYTIRGETSKDKQKSYLAIKELERKGIAYHFEMNARKDFNQKSGSASSTLDLLDINSNKDNSRLRSRFIFDIDKEGQFKINVPASSEKGNIPLLTRYENLSTYDSSDNGNPNKLLYNEDNLDIFLDSFAAPKTTLGEGLSFSKERGSIKLQDDKGEAGPIDRITEAHIKHGTAHHDILSTCWTHQDNGYINYQTGAATNITVDIDSIPLLDSIVSDTIIVSGTGLPENGGPNAGGRSGSINFDGSLEFNIGANTIDRQSLWMDLAGGAVLNFGRDKKLRSLVASMDGDVYMQVGSFGLTGDSRFIKDANGNFGAVLDLRIMTSGGYAHMIRFDNNGFTLMSPGNMAMHAKGSIKISSDSNIEFDCETLIAQGREVLKGFGGSI